MTNRLILVGANGFIGQTISAHFGTQDNWEVIELSHTAKDRQVSYNLLLDEPATLPIQTGSEYVVICSSLSLIDQCLQQPKVSTLLNVMSIIRLLKYLKQFPNIKLAYFSSDAVFDGTRGNYSETDTTCPNTLYGMQKVICEEFIQSQFANHLIFRMSKVFGNFPGNILASQIESIRNKQPTKCFTDQYISPVDVVDIAKSLDNAFKYKASGIFHLACDEQVTRYEVGKLICEKLNVTPDILVSTSLNEFNFLEPRARNSTLSNKKSKMELNSKFRSLETIIDQFLAI